MARDDPEAPFSPIAAALRVEADTEQMPGRPDVAPGGPYNIFTDPAPREFRRPLAPEPHPYTTEPGRLQIELDPLNFAYDRHNPDRENVRVRAWEVPVTFKLGVLHDVDFQVGVQAFAWERMDDVEARTRSRDHGFGDITLGSKINLWGNDEDLDHAFSVMPFVQLPTARHGLGRRAVQGGVMFPFAIVPAEGWEIEWTPQLGAIRDAADQRYELEVGSLLVFNRVIVENLEGFVELETLADTESGTGWAASINTGLTLELTPDTILEGAGLRRDAGGGRFHRVHHDRAPVLMPGRAPLTAPAACARNVFVIVPKKGGPMKKCIMLACSFGLVAALGAGCQQNTRTTNPTTGPRTAAIDEPIVVVEEEREGPLDFLAFWRWGEDEPDVITEDDILRDMSPEMVTMARTRGETRIRNARALDTDGRQFWDDLARVMLLDRPRRLSLYPVP